MPKPKAKAGATTASTNSTRQISVMFKLVLWAILLALLLFVLARLILPCVLSDPNAAQLALFADLSRWIERLITTLLALLAGKAL